MHFETCLKGLHFQASKILLLFKQVGKTYFWIEGSSFKSKLVRALHLYIDKNCQVTRIALTLSVTTNLLCFVVYADIANINVCNLTFLSHRLNSDGSGNRNSDDTHIWMVIVCQAEHLHDSFVIKLHLNGNYFTATIIGTAS